MNKTSQEKVNSIENDNSNSSIDTILNSSEFLKFLASHPDAKTFDMENEDEIKKRFEIFEKKESLKRELHSLYSSHIEQEMGIKLSGNDLSSIDTHLEKQAIENPEDIIEMQNKIDRFKGMPKQIEDLETKLGQLANEDSVKNKLLELDESRKVLERASSGKALKTRTAWKYMAWAFSSKENHKKRSSELKEDKDAWKIVEGKHGKIKSGEASIILKNVEIEIEKNKETLYKLHELSVLKKESEKMFGNTRKELFGGISEIKGLSEAIQNKAHAELRDLVSKNDLKSLESAVKKFEQFEQASEKTETGVNIFGSREEEERWATAIAASVENTVLKNTVDAVVNLDISKNPLASLEKALAPLMKKESWGEEFGSKIKEVVIAALKGVSTKLDKYNKVEDKVQNLLVKRMIFKLSSQE